MPAEFDNLGRRLSDLESDVSRVHLADAAAVRRRARQRTRNQAVGAVLGAVAAAGVAVLIAVQPTPWTAPEPAGTPGETSVTPDQSTEPPPLSDSELLSSGLVAEVRPNVGWSTVDPPAEPFACVPAVEPPDGGLVLRRSFQPESGDARIDQTVVSGDMRDARALFAKLRDSLTTCLEQHAGDSAYLLDQIWTNTGIGDDAWLARYWAPPNSQDARTLVEVTLARTGTVVTMLAYGGLAQDADAPPTFDLAIAAVNALCNVAGGPCAHDPGTQARTYPQPAPDLAGWLTVDDVAAVTGLARISGSTELLQQEDGTYGFVCLERSPVADGAAALMRRAYVDSLDPGGATVDEFVATFDSQDAADAHFDALIAVGEACPDAERTGEVTGTGYRGVAWRMVAPDTGITFTYGAVVNDGAVAVVNALTDGGAALTGEQMRALLARAGERLGELP